MKPSDPDTMLTAMVRVQELTSQTGQTFSLLTCDQQLYRVAVHVSWDQPERFKDMYLSLGALMSFAGAVGSLMAESGLSDILSEVFGGVPKMLSGKKFPQNVHALRMMAEELVRGLFMDHHFENTEDLMKALDQIASEIARVQLYHKEEAKARIQADAKVRAGLHRKLDSCIDPMDSKAHPEAAL